MGHLLTAETFKSIHRALKADGVQLVHSDNVRGPQEVVYIGCEVTYLRQLAESIGALRCFRDVGRSKLGVVSWAPIGRREWRERSHRRRW